jgi:nucleoside-diphosphate-sugar epimerase
MARVLVTGASGFIGTHLVAALNSRGDEVTCLVRKSSKTEVLQSLGAKFAYGDVTAAETLSAAVANKDVVYHAAGCTLTTRLRQFYEVNRRGVGNIARACSQQETPPVLVCVSSLAAVGPSVDDWPRVESNPCVPVSHYGRSKRAGELMAERFANRVPITIVRPPIVVGERDRLSLPLFRSVIQFGIHISPGIKSQRFSIIHADDLVHLMILAAKNGKRLPAVRPQTPNGQGYYFAACEQDPTYAELGRLVAESVGRRVLVIPTMLPFVQTVAAVGEVISHLAHHPLVMNLDKAREIAAGSWTCSAQAAREQLGYTAQRPLIERLRQTAAWYKQERWV